MISKWPKIGLSPSSISKVKTVILISREVKIKSLQMKIKGGLLKIPQQLKRKQCIASHLTFQNPISSKNPKNLWQFHSSLKVRTKPKIVTKLNQMLFNLRLTSLLATN